VGGVGDAGEAAETGAAGGGEGGYLLGRFSAADVAVGSYLLYLPQFFGKSGFAAELYPNIARSAYRKAYPGETDGVLAVCRSYVQVEVEVQV
ncbi:hypothetical protein B484DRAFT_401280, partial [Ochromonadaceae sp. CCMP2298]